MPTSDTPLPDGDRIRKLRLESGRTISQLAAEADLSEKTIGRLEKGKPCSLASLTSVAETFGVPLREIGVFPNDSADTQRKTVPTWREILMALGPVREKTSLSKNISNMRFLPRNLTPH
jgi:transcriptional regulator with XRE-family HTH domain